MDTNEARTILLQKSLSYEGFQVTQDGEWGSQTSDALKSFIDNANSSGFSGAPDPNEPNEPTSSIIESPPNFKYSPPTDKTSVLNSFYGTPSKNYPHLTVIRVPYEMVLSWDQSKNVTKISCHKKAAESLLWVLSQIQKTFGQEGILEHGLHLYGGCYNYRRMRGGSNWSRHAYGAAIDINPDENGLRTPWRADKVGQKGYGTMPVKAIEIFEKAGWKSGGRAWSRDSMHFQYTK